MKNKEQLQVKRIGTLKNGGIPCDIRSLPKCHAKAKSTGNRCGNIAMKGKGVCYIHGGKSPGGKLGNQNALKTGVYTAEAIAQKQFMRELIRETQELMAQI